jgi:hypothetical protein
MYERHDPHYPKSAWFYDKGFEAYLRLGTRWVLGERGLWVTIANMSVRGRRYARKGLMREMFVFCEDFAEQRPDIRGVFVESVLNADLRDFLLDRDYWHDAQTDILKNGYMGNWMKCAREPVRA